MKKKKDSGGMAFPSPANYSFNTENHDPIYGMTVRQYYAGKVLQGLAANPNQSVILALKNPKDFARSALALADALILEEETT